MHVDDLLYAMRSGQEQPGQHIEAFIQGVTDGTVSRPQAAAWLAWAFQRGLTDAETVALTQAMTRSGDVMDWGEGPTLIDKHSTGGVGDKVSLILAPLWAELGMRVPMISGRGLGLTGGTLDKLESIPGFQVQIEEEGLGKLLQEVGCFMGGQTGSLAPADRVLYALRNETCTVESVPLIVGSILSKKIAEGVSRLVLDVKAGSGAFMKDLDEARTLAEALVRVAKGAGLSCTALLTNMDRPLGRAVGNALEVREAADCLRGGGPEDLRELVVRLADHPKAAEVLASGKAWPRFLRLVEGHGGERASLERGLLRGEEGVTREVVLAPRGGYVAAVDAGDVGRAAFVLGAGRRRAEDPVDHGVGLLIHVKPGEAVEAGQPLYTVVHREGFALEEAQAMLATAYSFSEEPVTPAPLVHDVIV